MSRAAFRFPHQTLYALPYAQVGALFLTHLILFHSIAPISQVGCSVSTQQVNTSHHITIPAQYEQPIIPVYHKVHENAAL
jgi:hypothetical protein